MTDMEKETGHSGTGMEYRQVSWLRSLASRAGVAGMLACCAMVIMAVIWFQLFHINPPLSGTFIDVCAGDSIRDVSEQLYATGITSSPQSLRRYWQLRRGGSLRTGRYLLTGVDDMRELYLLFAKSSPVTVRVTIPEGYTVRQIAGRFQEEAGISAGDFLAAAGSDAGNLLEGYLFPDTYDVLYAGDARDIVVRMQKRFAEMLPVDWESAARSRGLTSDELVIVASIIEREVRYDNDRPLAGSVIFNRLAAGMLLQMDATLGYVLPSHDGFYSSEELKDPSPYNTYVHPGLPPTAICNPGLASLEAAAHAPATGYYYFLAKPDGHCVFARTFAEHERNIRRYLSGGN